LFFFFFRTDKNGKKINFVIKPNKIGTGKFVAD